MSRNKDMLDGNGSCCNGGFGGIYDRSTVMLMLKHGDDDDDDDDDDDGGGDGSFSDQFVGYVSHGHRRACDPNRGCGVRAASRSFKPKAPLGGLNM